MAAEMEVHFNPETGEMVVKIDGLPDQQCTDITKILQGALGMGDAKVKKTQSINAGDDASRSESVHRG